MHCNTLWSYESYDYTVSDNMALMAMLFALVFVTELISWIGQSVLLEFVRYYPCFLLGRCAPMS